MTSEKVQVLVSTYNGERYLKKQLDSLIAQSYPNVEIIVRDDGSSDKTASILKVYEERYYNIRVYLEDNVGVTNSFFALLGKTDADYVAFCDQDDIWLPKKIEKAVDVLRDIEGPALYCSNKILIDAKDQLITENNRKQLRPGFENAVIECICTGCTAVLNRQLADNIKEHLPRYAILHDWWCYLVASYLGTVVFDAESYIWYRQHENNVVGASKSFWGNMKAKARYLKNNKGKLKRQLTEFQRLYREDAKKDSLIDLLQKADEPLGRWKAIFCKSYHRQSFFDNLIVRCLFLVNRML